MKKGILFFLLLPVLAFAQGKDAGFEIKGNIAGLKDSTLVFLLSGTDGKTVASTYASQGMFELKGKLAGADIFQLGFVNQPTRFELFIQNEPVSITGDYNDLSHAVIKASALQDDFELFKQRFNPLKDKINKTNQAITQEKDDGRRNLLRLEFDNDRNKVIAAAVAFIKEKPASAVSPFVLYVISPLLSGVEELEAKYNQLHPSAKVGTYARVVEKTIADAKVGAIGTQAISFTQKDTANKSISLESFRGKYVLVDFWASWCRPCRMENPNVVSAFNQYKDKNFTVLGVSLDQSKDSWLQAIRVDKLNWTHVSDLQYWNNAVAQLYRIQGIPANLLIDPNGKIIARDLREQALHRKLKELLEK